MELADGRYLIDQQIDDVARQLTQDPAKLNRSIMEFVAKQLNSELRTEIFDRLLGTTSGDALQFVLRSMRSDSGWPATSDAIEGALLRLTKESDYDLDQVAFLAKILAIQKPSEALFPVAMRMIQAESQRHRGIFIAKSLGREELIPPLVTLLDSMDAQTRASAKDAIDAILEVKRIRDEAAAEDKD